MGKNHRMGGKQKKGTSRAKYFAARKAYLAAANKKKRIEKNEKEMNKL